ncbi:MAG: hypothetical protein FWG89_04720 [Treponema sp.]|nr:hypothetical protein [Treponema sp.]
MKNTFVLGLSILLLTGLFIMSCQNDIETTEGNFARSATSEICTMDKITGLYDDNFFKSWADWEEAREYFFIEFYEFTNSSGVSYTRQKWTDDFGGVFIDSSGIVNILVAGNNMPVKSDNLIYKQVSNSYNFLEIISDRIVEKMDEHTIWQVSIDEICNKVFVCLENEKEINSLIIYLKANNLFKTNTLKIFVGKNDIVPQG